MKCIFGMIYLRQITWLVVTFNHHTFTVSTSRYHLLEITIYYAHYIVYTYICCTRVVMHCFNFETFCFYLTPLLTALKRHFPFILVICYFINVIFSEEEMSKAKKRVCLYWTNYILTYFVTFAFFLLNIFLMSYKQNIILGHVTNYVKVCKGSEHFLHMYIWRLIKILMVVTLCLITITKYCMNK
jgi:hypothetical protein